MSTDTRAALVEQLEEVVTRWHAEADRLHAAHSPEALDGDQPWDSDYEGRGRRNAFRQCADEIDAIAHSAPEERGEGERERCPECGDWWCPDDLNADCENAFHGPRREACGCVRKPGRWGTHLVTACPEHQSMLPEPPASPPAPVEGERLLEERIAEIRAARELVFRLAADGDRAWRMSVPVQDDDSDTLLMRVLDRAEKDAAEVARLTAEVDRRDAMIERFMGMHDGTFCGRCEAELTERERGPFKPLDEAFADPRAHVAARRQRARAMHDAVTGAPEVWDELDGAAREEWAGTADEYQRLIASPVQGAGGGEREALAKISRIIAGIEPGMFESDPYKRLGLVQEIALPYGLADRESPVTFQAMHEAAAERAVQGAGGGEREIPVCAAAAPVEGERDWQKAHDDPAWTATALEGYARSMEADGVPGAPWVLRRAAQHLHASHPVEGERERIENVLRTHRLSYYLDEDGDNLGLVDALSPGEDISTGLAEIRILADEIDAALASHPVQGARGGEREELAGRLDDAWRCRGDYAPGAAGSVYDDAEALRALCGEAAVALASPAPYRAPR